MDIKIKNIGNNSGTSGWLKDELELGRMWFQEGVTTEGSLGLWLKSDGESMCIALYNPYNMVEKENAICMPLRMSDHHDDPGAIVNKYNLTPAALRSVKNVAQKWCDKRNEEREQDAEIDIVVIFK